MGEAYYRTGQAAKILGISSYHLRRLCELGMIEAEYTGHQWRPFVSAVETMQQTGVPPIPSGEIAPREANGAHLLAPPSEHATTSAEEALMSEHQLTKARNTLERMKLEREANEITDQFEERERQAAARKEARQRQMELEQQTAAQRRRWEERKNECLSRAMRFRTWDIPKEADLDIAREVSAVLETLGPNDPESFVERQVEGAISKALAPWREREGTEHAIREACDFLNVPHQLSRDDIRNSARLAAREAITKLPVGSRREEKIVAAKRAAERIQRDAEHRANMEAVLRSGMGLRGATPQDEEQASAAIRRALAVLTDASQGEMERAAEQAIKPIRAAVEARLDASMRENVMAMAGWGLRIPEATKRQVLAEVEGALREMPRGTPQRELKQARDVIVERAKCKLQLVEDGVNEVPRYLRQLQNERRLGRNENLITLASQLQEKIRHMLEWELTGNETEEDVLKQVHRAIRQALRIPSKNSH